MKKAALSNVDGAEAYRIWFQREYKIPPHHPMMRDISWHELVLTYWEHRYLENPKEADADRVLYEDANGYVDRDWIEFVDDCLAKGLDPDAESKRIKLEQQKKELSQVAGNMDIDADFLGELEHGDNQKPD